MPTGPKGEKRPADVIGNAVKVMRIATGEIEEEIGTRDSAAASRAGKHGGAARAKTLSPRRRKKIAENAAATRWKKEPESAK
jgi:hypothetical protein